MHFSTFLPLVAAALTSAQPVLDSLVGDLLDYQPGYCANSPYSGILPFLDYPPAEDYCESSYPVPPYTDTYTKTHVKTHYNTHYKWSTATEGLYTKTVYKHDKRGHTKADEWKTWSKGYKGDWTSACSCIQTTDTYTTTSPTTTTVTIITTIPTDTTTTIPTTTITIS